MDSKTYVQFKIYVLDICVALICLECTVSNKSLAGRVSSRRSTKFWYIDMTTRFHPLWLLQTIVLETNISIVCPKWTILHSGCITIRYPELRVCILMLGVRNLTFAARQSDKRFLFCLLLVQGRQSESHKNACDQACREIVLERFLQFQPTPRGSIFSYLTPPPFADKS